MTQSLSPDRRTYVLDTSVLLSDPWACNRFAEHEVVVPLVVISELEAKRHHHELGWFARQALRMFDDLRIEHGRLDQPIPVGTQGGTLQVELNHSDPTVLPAGFRTDTNDARILTCAANLAAEGKRVTLVSKDIPLRVKAGAVGLPADEYHAQDVDHLGLDRHVRARCRHRGDRHAVRRGRDRPRVDARNLPCHTGVRLLGGKLARPGPGERRQEGAAGPRRSRGVRPPGKVSRTTRRPRPAARRVGRHRVAGRQGRHRQVGAGAVRRPGGGAGASHAAQGRGVPPAVRRRRAGARLSAGQRERQDGAVGAGRVRHPGGPGQPRRCSKRCSPAGCSRCCR